MSSCFRRGKRDRGQVGRSLFLHLDKTDQDAAHKVAGRKKEQARALAGIMAAQPAVKVIAEVASEVRQHVDETDRNGRSGSSKRQRRQRPKWRRPEVGCETRGAQPRHNNRKGLAVNRTASQQQRRGELAAHAMPFAVSGAVGGLAGNEDTHKAAGIKESAIKQGRVIGTAGEILHRRRQPESKRVAARVCCEDAKGEQPDIAHAQRLPDRDLAAVSFARASAASNSSR